MASPNSNRPSSPGLRLTEFEQLVRLFPDWQGKFEQVTSGQFEGTILAARGRQLKAYFASIGQAILARGREKPGLLTIALVLPAGADCRWQQRRFAPGRLVVRGGEVAVDHHASRNALHMYMTLSEEKFREAARVLTKSDLGTISWFGVQPSPHDFSKLKTNLSQFLTATNDKANPSHENELLEQACLRAAVESILPPTSRRIDLPLSARTALIRRAEELMLSRLSDPIGEIDMCAELGVSGRTLRLSFRERFGIGPIMYYKALRLNAARAALAAANSETLSIKEIGQAFGFHHASKFAGYYRRHFGELPSETLARRLVRNSTSGIS